MTSLPLRLPAKGGFSLVEVVIAMGIIAVAVVSMVGMLSGLLTTEGETVNRTTSPQITAHALATIKADQIVNKAVPPTTSYIFHYNNEGIAVAQAEAVFVCSANLTSASATGVFDPGTFTSLVRMEIKKPNAQHAIIVYGSIQNE